MLSLFRRRRRIGRLNHVRIGSLIYLTLTRLDMLCAIGCDQLVYANYEEPHLEAVQLTLRNVKRMVDNNLLYKKSKVAR